MTDYCTIAEIRHDMPESPLDTETDYDTALAEMITSASRLIDQTVGRWPNYFQPSTDTEVRYYNGQGGHILEIDEAVSISEVAVSEAGGVSSSDYTVWASTDYYTEPYNASALGIPIRRIVNDQLNGSQSGFFSYRRGVRVTGRFGYASTVPSNVNRLCRIQVLRWFMLAKQAYMDNGASPEVGQMYHDRTLDAGLIRKFLYQYILENSAA